MPIYELPDLAYDYGALEPHVSGQIMELHHGKHHAAYVTGANQTHERLDEARSKGEYGSITMLEKNLAFHTSGHVLHTIFWRNLSPTGGDKPSGELAQAIDKDFGSFDAFKAQLTQATNTVQGSGWGVLGFEPFAQRLVIQQVYDHQGNLATGATPMLVIDAWEHAYYLQYKNVRADFVNAVWNIINWQDVADSYKAVKAG